MKTLMYYCRTWSSQTVSVCKMKIVESLTEDRCYTWSTGETLPILDNFRSDIRLDLPPSGGMISFKSLPTIHVKPKFSVMEQSLSDLEQMHKVIPVGNSLYLIRMKHKHALQRKLRSFPLTLFSGFQTYPPLHWFPGLWQDLTHLLLAPCWIIKLLGLFRDISFSSSQGCKCVQPLTLLWTFLHSSSRMQLSV